MALDLRGHGLSDKPARGYEVDHLLADFESVPDVLKVKGKIVLVGHSFGGAIATEYTLNIPSKLSA